MHLHPVNANAAGPLVPLICMPGPDGDGQAVFERLRPLAEANLDFPALLVCPDLRELEATDGWADAFAQAKAEYQLTDRGLIYGHGPGARLAQHFTLDHPESVFACAALSADAWAEPTDAPDPKALTSVVWLIGCGAQEAPGLVRGAEHFQVGLAELGCTVDFLDWDGGAENVPDHAVENALRFFGELRDAAQAA